MEEHGHPTELYNEMIHGSGVGVFATWYGACWALIEACRVVTGGDTWACNTQGPGLCLSVLSSSCLQPASHANTWPGLPL